MPTTSKQETYTRAAELAARLQALAPERLARKSAQSAVELLRLADRLTRYAETACNYQLTDKQERAIAKLEARVRAICTELGIGCKFNGDPRGYIVRLMLPSGDYNTWGGPEEGYGI